MYWRTKHVRRKASVTSKISIKYEGWRFPFHSGLLSLTVETKNMVKYKTVLNLFWFNCCICEETKKGGDFSSSFVEAEYAFYIMVKKNCGVMTIMFSTICIRFQHQMYNINLFYNGETEKYQVFSVRFADDIMRISFKRLVSESTVLFRSFRWPL